MLNNNIFRDSHVIGRLTSARVGSYSSAPICTSFVWNHGRNSSQIDLTSGIESGLVRSNKSFFFNASSGFHLVRKRQCPGASISGMIVTPRRAQCCWRSSKSARERVSFAR
ncbi:hypothetical protein ACKS0A_01969 [Histoplasma ohiense]